MSGKPVSQFRLNALYWTLSKGVIENKETVKIYGEPFK